MRTGLLDYKEGGKVRVISSLNPNFEFLVGEIGTVTEVGGRYVLAIFPDVKYWDYETFICYPEEIEKV